MPASSESLRSEMRADLALLTDELAEVLPAGVAIDHLQQRTARASASYRRRDSTEASPVVYRRVISAWSTSIRSWSVWRRADSSAS